MAEIATIKLSDAEAVEIVDPESIRPAYVDFVGRKIHVVSRLRISKARASIIYGLLGNMLNGPKVGDEPKKAMN